MKVHPTNPCEDSHEWSGYDSVRRIGHRIFDFAAPVAVTTSLVDPVLDFEINTRGSLNLLEPVRH